MNVVPDRKPAATDSTVSRLPLGKRLAQINQTTFGIALVLVALAVMVTSFFLNLHNLRQGVVVAADMLAENAGAPLVFNDRKVAVDLLRTLRHSPDNTIYWASMPLRLCPTIASLRTLSTPAYNKLVQI